METMYDNTKKSVLTNTTKGNNNYIFELESKNFQLKNERIKLISFLEDKIKENKEELGFDTYGDIELNSKTNAFQEVLDFVNKGSKE